MRPKRILGVAVLLVLTACTPASLEVSGCEYRLSEGGFEAALDQAGEEPEIPRWTLNSLSSSTTTLVIWDGEETYYATGFWIAEGIVATASHAIDGAELIVVAELAGGGRILEVSSYVRDPEKDLALLLVKGESEGEPLPIGDPLDLRRGDPIYTLKFVLGSVDVQGGNVVGTMCTNTHTVPLLFTNNRIELGNSGGPALNSRGEVVGIVSGMILKDWEEAAGTVIVPINYVLDLLDTVPR